VTARDDDHDDDGQLRQLRQVWVSMRDEEPSERGLASLMAAAREKASQLEAEAQPSWWQRTLATLRRPPVIALATVTVLLGGALFVTQRSSKMKVEATAPSTVSDGDATESRAPGVENTKLSDELWNAPAAAPVETPRPADPAGSTMSVGGSGSASSTVVPPAPRTQRPSPPKIATQLTSRSSSQPSPSANVIAREKNDEDDGVAPPAAPAERTPRGAVTPTVPMTESTAPVARAPLPPIDGEDRRPTVDSSSSTAGEKTTTAAPSIEQLVKQCESAAARNDCAAVRVIARRIATASPSVYKKRVGTNVVITRCLSVSE
jgi:hypothetical protein